MIISNDVEKNFRQNSTSRQWDQDDEVRCGSPLLPQTHLKKICMQNESHQTSTETLAKEFRPPKRARNRPHKCIEENGKKRESQRREAGESGWDQHS